MLQLDSAAFAGRSVFMAHGAGDLATNALSFAKYNGPAAYLLPNNVALQNLTNAVSFGLRVEQGGKTVREEFKRYTAINNPAFKGRYNLASYPATNVFAVKAGEDLTLTYLYKLTAAKVADYNQLSMGYASTGNDMDALLSFLETSVAKRYVSNFAATKETFSGLSAVKPQNANTGDAPDHLYQNTFTLLNRKAGAPTTGPAMLHSGIKLSPFETYSKSGLALLRFDALP